MKLLCARFYGPVYGGLPLLDPISSGGFFRPWVPKQERILAQDTSSLFGLASAVLFSGADNLSIEVSCLPLSLESCRQIFFSVTPFLFLFLARRFF